MEGMKRLGLYCHSTPMLQDRITAHLEEFLMLSLKMCRLLLLQNLHLRRKQLDADSAGPSNKHQQHSVNYMDFFWRLFAWSC